MIKNRKILTFDEIKQKFSVDLVQVLVVVQYSCSYICVRGKYIILIFFELFFEIIFYTVVSGAPWSARAFLLSGSSKKIFFSNSFKARGYRVDKVVRFFKKLRKRLR